MLLMNSRRTIYFNIAFFAVLIVVYLVVNFRESDPGQGQVVSFESAGLERPLTPLAPDRKALSFKNYRGTPILLHFWASWCEPCTRDEKKLNELFSATGGRGTHFVSIASEDKREAIKRMGKLDAYPGDVYVDPSGDLARVFSVKAYPYTLLIDKGGQIIFRGEGPLTEEDFHRLKQELAESAARVVTPFKFPEAKGGTLSSEALADKVWVANFIFTSCGNVCPMISEKLRALQEEFGQNPNFRLVSFSVDPKRDLPARLQAFGRQHGANPEIWSFLRPSSSDLKELMVKGFRLGTDENPLLHTAKIVVVNKGNTIQSYYDGDAQDAVQKLKGEVGSLLK